MGFVVFEVNSGRAVKYYRKESAAKAQVTKNNKSFDAAWTSKLGYNPLVNNFIKKWTYCSYAEYEGVLMGMNEPERKIWAFCRGGKNG
jgi:hypothetical protein